MHIADELGELNDIQHCGLSLLQYALALPPTASISAKGARWVCDPNYVTFQVHHKRANNIRVSLRGSPEEYESFPELQLKSGMAGYSEFSFETADQLFAAAAYIRRAWQIFQKGRGRSRGRPITVGE